MHKLGKLGQLENYDFVKVTTRYCDNCKKRTKTEVYDGHTFCEMTKLEHCLSCGQRVLV